MKTAALALSLLLNVGLAAILLYSAAMGCAEIPNGKLGVLTQDIRVGTFGENRVLFTLPKGLLVRDASALGADWFEPNRFRLVVTSDSKALVDYSAGKKEGQEGEYYSAKVRGNER